MWLRSSSVDVDCALWCVDICIYRRVAVSEWYILCSHSCWTYFFLLPPLVTCVYATLLCTATPCVLILADKISDYCTRYAWPRVGYRGPKMQKKTCPFFSTLAGYSIASRTNPNASPASRIIWVQIKHNVYVVHTLHGHAYRARGLNKLLFYELHGEVWGVKC